MPQKPDPTLHYAPAPGPRRTLRIVLNGIVGGLAGLIALGFTAVIAQGLWSSWRHGRWDTSDVVAVAIGLGATGVTTAFFAVVAHVCLSAARSEHRGRHLHHPPDPQRR